MLRLTRFLVALLPAAIFIPACKTTKDPTIQTRNLPAVEVKPGTDTPPAYKASVTRQFNLIHTSLEVSFDYEKLQMPGKATVQLKPHFYSSESVVLNARGMLIKRVASLSGKDTLAVKYRYQNDSLIISTGRAYTKADTLTLYIEYTARPEELKDKAEGRAVRDDKGIYFINPQRKVQGVPRQIWTQSEPQAASVWFPTLDAPNQRMTQQIKITADNSDVTLSNGLMISTVDNKNGTHTDTWRMDLPHAPYLAMMAIGPYAVVKDKWRDKEVSYYVDQEYKDVARKIFGNTPEMMEFFSKKLGVDYPWAKYSQVTAHEYVSGAMENTTATVHMLELQRNERQLIDGTNEDYVSHELFHQWFGDLVTCESWANTPLNEGFATYGEYLWNEYKYGREAADYGFAFDLNIYLREAQHRKLNLIRYDYDKIDDMFDRHSYQKGSCILHLLRKEVGDDAFFASLKLYLEKNKFQSVEAANLRLAFEEVTGRDLNWYFDQWFFDKGHPELDINYKYDAENKTIAVTIKQLQDSAGIRLFRLNLETDIYLDNAVERKMITVSKKEETFTFPVRMQPQLVNVDATKTVLAEKNDHHTTAEWSYQYHHAPLYIDRVEAIRAMPENAKQDSPESKLLYEALNDKFWHVRGTAVKRLNTSAYADSTALKNKLKEIARSDSKSLVQAMAIQKLNDNYSGPDLKAFFLEMMQDSSYLVMESALQGLIALDSLAALNAAHANNINRDAEVLEMNTDVYGHFGNESDAAYMHGVIKETTSSDLYNILGNYGMFLKRLKDESELANGINILGDKAKNAEPWYVRLTAMQSLSDLSATFKNAKESAAKSGDKAAEEKYSRLQSQAETIILAVKNYETDESLKKIYQNQK